jgi:hypothetical protein
MRTRTTRGTKTCAATFLLFTLAFALPSLPGAAQVTMEWFSFSGTITLKTKGNSLSAGDFRFASVKGNTVLAGVKITNSSGSYFNHTYSVGGTFADGLGTTTLTPSPTSFSVSIPPHSWTTQSITFSGMPNRIGKGTLTATITSGTDIYTLSNGIYQIFASPQSPMNAPWIEVLDDAMSWAGGNTTADDIDENLTLGLYITSKFKYTTVNGLPSSWTDSTDQTIFLLTNFVNNTTWPTEGNCVDVSEYLCICANALGMNFECARYKDSGGATIFDTNLLCPIGSDWTNSAKYVPQHWNNHQICRRSAGSGEVYDACGAYRYDLSGNSWMAAAWGWPFPDWWQNSSRYGLVWNPFASSPALYSPPGAPFAPTIR